ncbi:MAG: MBL fold metallo-hydrolase [Parvibaculum sp.]|uniref:MBL fold metallo-hydrolase n=1 Tax=Parvibaculum sp. TaxID=2024848 RepID=UPI0025F31BE6|nr:MBL fold metallo-hydrolase [Parvibaculum sp.]MCE9648409.1 MBL fold metallo-hydrolase [Parvibaculum sp.]
MAGRGVKIVGGIAAAVVALAVIAYGVVMTVPSVQDALMVRVIKARLSDRSQAALLTDGGLHLAICGSGSPMPDPTRANACTAVIAGGHIVIIDTGPGSWKKFAQMRLPGGKIDTILLTHLHSDHIGDLGEFAVQSWINGRDKPLDIFGPAKLPSPALAPDSEGHEYGTSGTLDVVKGFALAYDADSAYRILHHGADYLIPDGARIVGHEIQTPNRDELVTVYDKDGLKISAFLVDHHPIEPAYGFRVEYAGRVAVLSGDTKKTESVERFSKGADLLIHEALNHDMVKLMEGPVKELNSPRLSKMLNDTINYHTSPVEAAEIAKAAGVKLLVYSHIVPPLVNALSEKMFMRGVAEARGDGDVRIGHDGMLISLPAGSDKVEVSNLN